MATTMGTIASVAFLHLPTTIAALAAALTAAHLSVASGRWLKRLHSAAAAAAHAASVVAADILVLPNSISNAAAHIPDVLWGHLLGLCHHVRVMQLNCKLCREQWLSLMLAAAHRARAAVARWAAVFSSCFILLKFIVEKECSS